jgi:ribosomal protein S19
MRFTSNYGNLKKKITYCSPIFWKKMYLYSKLPILKPYEMSVYSRSSIIPEGLLYCEAKIHNGRKWHMHIVSRWIIGFKFGELTWNRRLAVYKSKQLKKKKKKINKK